MKPPHPSPPFPPKQLRDPTMSTDAEMAAYGKAAVFLRKPEKERIEAQTRPFDAKAVCYVVDEKELYLKATIVKRDKDQVTVKLLLSEEVGHSGWFLVFMVLWAGALLHRGGAQRLDPSVYGALGWGTAPQRWGTAAGS